MKFLKKWFPCRFNEPKCRDNIFGCKCGKGGSSSPPTPPPVPDPTAQAEALVNAQISQAPRAAQAGFDILSNPQYGLLPTTQLYEQARQQAFPQENLVRNQLAQVILQNLISPTGISSEQQSSINTRRQQSQGELQRALRERANLGGGLYGGRSAEEEGRAVSDLQRAFSEEDVNREERSRLNSIQAALPFLQLLFPNVGITNPQFTNPVQSPDTYSSSLTSQRGQDIQQQIAAQQAQAQQQASQSALYGALFQGLGTAAGGFLGPGGAMATSIAGRSAAGRG